MKTNLEKLAYEWIIAETGKVDVAGDFYCQTRDIFEARNDRMPEDLIEKGLDDSLAYLVYAMAGELGNNSFDHNVGNWPNMMGVFYAFDYDGKEGILVIADRGVGVLNSLRKAIPDLKNDKDALEIAFTKKISSRVLENRGNGLKFVRGNVSKSNLLLEFFSGKARAELNHEMKITDNSEAINGCLVILKF